MKLLSGYVGKLFSQFLMMTGALLTLVILPTKVQGESEPIWILEQKVSARTAQRLDPGETLTLLTPKVYFFSSILDPRSIQWFVRDSIYVPDHPAIKRYLKYYQTKGRITFAKALRRSWAYVPTMMEIFLSHGLPRELVYMVMVESGFSIKSRSKRGAVGLWQLMPATARAMGLIVNYWIDERLDPVRATQAAARYLCELYDRFGSWPLALAAYNAGSATVYRAIRRTRSRDFWQISKFHALPLQTRSYVPKVLATIKIIRNLDVYRFKIPRYFPIHPAITIPICKSLSLHQIARWTGIPLKRLRILNPALRHDRIPGGVRFHLRLPLILFERFSRAYEHS